MNEFVKSECVRKRILEFISYGEKIDRMLLERNFPNKLYKYKSLNEYALKGLENVEEYLANPKTFNDIFDSRRNIDNKSIEVAKDKYLIQYILRLNDCIDTLIKENDEFIERCAERTIFSFQYFTSISRALCFTEDNKSNLMWSHYARNSTGICLEYCLKENIEYKNNIYPIKYLDKPIDISKLERVDLRNYDKEVELGIILSIITKSKEWEYEKEWRLFLAELEYMDSGGGEVRKFIKPKKIFLGSRFFEILYYLDKENRLEEETVSGRLGLIKRLFNYSKKNGIEVLIVSPIIGSYELHEINIDTDEVLSILAYKQEKGTVQKLNKYINELMTEKYIEEYKYIN